MNTYRKTDTIAGGVQESAATSPAPTRAKRMSERAQSQRDALIREARIRAGMRSPDEVIPDLGEEDRDTFIRDMIETLQAML